MAIARKVEAKEAVVESKAVKGKAMHTVDVQEKEDTMSKVSTQMHPISGEGGKGNPTLPTAAEEVLEKVGRNV